ncbi:phosphotransferase [Alicyclobacillus acidiphilus]|uniref:phosphotransferase n=1 Tax=Alicyclobacillus acidiphilus TaxID=182455 RepID=UPI000ABCFC6F|nr:phosphotransferase [Alicyclobacillus acidiphilus]
MNGRTRRSGWAGQARTGSGSTWPLPITRLARGSTGGSVTCNDLGGEQNRDRRTLARAKRAGLVDELDIDEELVRRLITDQFPHWAELPLRRVEPAGTVNAIYRLGDEYSVRLARREGPTTPGSREFTWLPKLAPLVPLEVPVPIAQGHPNHEYPWFWEIHTWLDGKTVPIEEIDVIQAALDRMEVALTIGSRCVPRGSSNGRRNVGKGPRMGRTPSGRNSRLLYAANQSDSVQ